MQKVQFQFVHGLPGAGVWVDGEYANATYFEAGRWHYCIDVSAAADVRLSADTHEELEAAIVKHYG